MTTFSALHFGEPRWLFALLLIPGLALLFWRAEHNAGARLAKLIASPRLRAQLTGAASAGRRRWRYALLLLGLGSLAVTMAHPQLGYFEETVHRKGLDLILIADVSKSMLAIDLPPNRLTREKLAAEDLIGQLTGDRVGLVAFAGTAFLQAPITVDYDAVRAALTELDTETIPQGGTNLKAAIDLALEAFGKAEGHNRAIVLLSDGEATTGEAADARNSAARAAQAGVRIFTLGIGTPEGSMIPLGEPGQFVRDPEGKVVQTKLDESALTDIAKATDGFYLRLQTGQGDVQRLMQDGLRKMKEGDIDARDARRPIERYQWPLGAAIVLLGGAMALGERRKLRAPLAAATAAILLAPTLARGVEQDPLKLYGDGKYDEAYHGFSQLAQKHPKVDNLDFDAGSSAYRGGKYNEAMNAFAKALTSPDPALQEKSHYNFGNTLFKRGEAEKETDARVQNWRNALQHYDNAIALAKTNKDSALGRDAAANREYVQKQIDEALKPKPTPPPQQQQDKKDQEKDKDKKDDKKQQQDQQQQQQQKDKQDAQDKKDGKEQQQQGAQSSPSPSASPSPGQDGASPSPSPGAQPSPGASPSPAPGEDKPRPRGDVKPQDDGKSPDEKEMAQAQEAPEPGKMNADQARALLDSLRGEDQRVNFNEHADKRNEPGIKDW